MKVTFQRQKITVQSKNVANITVFGTMMGTVMMERWLSVQ